jgi:hypothetical protein
MNEQSIAEKVFAKLKYGGRICPKCGKKIDYLIYNAYELQKATFDGNEYSNWDSLGDIKGEAEYSCPHCNTVLFTDEKSAKEFLECG